MRGDVERTEDLFSYVPLADRVPSDHPLRSLAGLRTHTDLELSSAGDPPKGPMEILEKVMGYSRGCLAIGIGEDRRSRSFPSHTTRHAGPHLAVR